MSFKGKSIPFVDLIKVAWLATVSLTLKFKLVDELDFIQKPWECGILLELER